MLECTTRAGKLGDQTSRTGRTTESTLERSHNQRRESQDPAVVNVLRKQCAFVRRRATLCTVVRSVSKSDGCTIHACLCDTRTPRGEPDSSKEHAPCCRCVSPSFLMNEGVQPARRPTNANETHTKASSSSAFLHG